eukprot:s5253_g9.t1
MPSRPSGNLLRCFGKADVKQRFPRAEGLLQTRFSADLGGYSLFRRAQFGRAATIACSREDSSAVVKTLSPVPGIHCYERFLASCMMEIGSVKDRPVGRLHTFECMSSSQPEELPLDDLPLLSVSRDPSPSPRSTPPEEEQKESSASDESDDDVEVVEEKEPLEEMRGWLMCYGEPSGGNRLQVARLAKASAGTPVAGLFWKKRYIQLVDAQLLCWATAPQHRGSRVAPVAVLLLAQLEEVAVTGKTLTLHMRNQKGCLQARAESDESANTWARAVKAHAGRAISKSLPPGWDVEAMLSRGMGGSAAKMVNKETLDSSCNDAFQKLLDHCFVCKTTKDRRGNPVPMRLEIAEAVRVQNGAAWLEYDKARRRICDKVFSAYQWDKQHSDSESCSSSMTAAERGLHSAHTTVSDLGSSEGQSWDPFGMQSSLLTSTLDCKQLHETLGKRDTSSNEQWLFHGTSAAAVQHISDQEFRLDKAGSHRGTLYGKGIYFAECVTKADEYCEEDADGYCWMLLCRVALGKVMTCKEKKPPADILDQCKAGGYDSLLGDRWAAVGTFREFILYDSDQVYPAFILRYRRWSEAPAQRDGNGGSSPARPRVATPKSDDSGSVKSVVSALPMDETTSYAVKARTEMVHRVLEGLRDEAFELASDIGIESLTEPGGLRAFITQMRNVVFPRAAEEARELFRAGQRHGVLARQGGETPELFYGAAREE